MHAYKGKGPAGTSCMAYAQMVSLYGHGGSHCPAGTSMNKVKPPGRSHRKPGQAWTGYLQHGSAITDHHA